MKPVFAAVDIESTFSPARHFPDIGSLVSAFVPNIFTVAGIIAFALLILGGFGFIVGSGAGDTKQMEQGKKALTGASIGLIVIFGSFWIIQIVEKLTGLPLLPIK
jgi:hypothetical protein